MLLCTTVLYGTVIVPGTPAFFPATIQSDNRYQHAAAFEAHAFPPYAAQGR